MILHNHFAHGANHHSQEVLRSNVMPSAAFESFKPVVLYASDSNDPFRIAEKAADTSAASRKVCTRLSGCAQCLVRNQADSAP